MNTVTDLAAFAVARRPLQDRGADSLLGSVRWALRRYNKTESWSRTIVNAAERVLRRTYRAEAGRVTSKELRAQIKVFRDTLRENLDKTKAPTPGDFDSKAEAIARWVANAAINAGTHAAGNETNLDTDAPNVVKTWVTMHDDLVRPAHREVDGITVGLGQTFTVGGVVMRYPGDPVAPPELTINCRCVLAIRTATLAASADQGETMTVTEMDIQYPNELIGDDELDDTVSPDEVEVPWHGVLAPEDVLSGDGRKFGPEALRWRDLPLPLGWQKVSDDGHKGSVVVGRIDEVWREGNLIKASGMFLQSDESEEAIRLIADGGIRGVSVDVDDATMELQHADGSPYDMSKSSDEMPVTVFPSGRICGATLCAIPAFAEAFVSLGDWHERGGITADASDHEDCGCEFAIDEGSWDGSAGRYTDEQYYRATIIHLVTSGPDRLKKSNNKLPILTPEGKLSRAGVHAAVSRLNQTDAPPEKISAAKAALRSAYKELKEDPPDAITASAAEHVNTTPSTAMVEAATRALGWVRDGLHGGLDEYPVVQARVLAAGGELNHEQVARMQQFFARHSGSNEPGWNPGENGYPSAERVLWDLWGGDSAARWASRRWEQILSLQDEQDDEDALDFRTKTEDGPGWLTHPVDTERLRRYWTRGAGARKIRWGTPGDFNRCRRLLAKYVKPQYLSGYCANRHYDATGFWPGDAPAERGARRKKHSDGSVGFPNEVAPALNLVASAVPKVSARFFDNPNLTTPTPVTITEEGRIFGHLATWGTCHIGISGTCVTPPVSRTDYAYFRVGAVHTDEGEIPVGHITLGTGHAGPRLSAASAASHYDNTGTVAADVVAGEDAVGIWISGRVRDRLSDEDRHDLAAAPLSGDWRAIRGNLELVAALAVNVGGFPVPRTALAASGGEQTSLVAAGVLDRSSTHVMSGLDLGAAIMAAVDEIEARKARKDMADLAKSLGRDPRGRMAALREKMTVSVE